MNPSEVPGELIDLAMTGAAPGCRDDAAFYLANALPEHERQVREQVAQKILADQQRREKTHVPPGRPDALARQYGERKGMQRAAEIARGGS